MSDLAPLSSHLDELRKVLIKTLIAILMGVIFSLYYSEEILHFILKSLPLPNLFFFSPQEGFLSIFKLAFWMGVLGTSPYWLFGLFRFIKPALSKKHQFAFPGFLLLSMLFIVASGFFCLWLTIPIANGYLYSFNAHYGTNLWGFGAYVDYLLLLVFAHGITFELGALLLLLIHLQVISPESLARKRRHAVVVALILGALLTPPDIITQLLVAVPLYGFFELAILYGRSKLYFTRT